MSIANLVGKLNGVVSQGQNYLGTAQSIGQLFGLDVADALGLVDQPSKVETDANGFSFNNFRSNIGEIGIVRPVHFLCEIPIPKILNQPPPSIVNADVISQLRNNDARIITLLTEAVSMPGVTYLTSDNIRRYGYGQVDSRPYNVNMTDISLTFLFDAKAKVHEFFYDWTRGIVPYDVRNKQTTDNSRNYYLASFKRDYVVDLKIEVFNERTKKLLVCTLRDAFPVAIDPVQFNWGSTDEIAKINITFKYTDWKVNHISLSNRGEGTDGIGLNWLQKLQSGVGVIQTLSSLTRPNSLADVVNTVGNLQLAKVGIANLF
jgi:hypothetical protein